MVFNKVHLLGVQRLNRQAGVAEHARSSLPGERRRQGVRHAGEDEGGPVMMANICAPAGKTNHELLMNCGGEGKLSIRYLPAEFLPAVSGYKTDIEFSFDQEMFTRPAQYEEMDGALVVDIDIDSPFFSVLQSQKQMMLSDTAGKAPGATFTLKGSKAALAKLIATCSKQ